MQEFQPRSIGPLGMCYEICHIDFLCKAMMRLIARQEFCRFLAGVPRVS
jgi:hypothetical protein